MDTLHKVLRTISGETKSKASHLTVFREFLAHLDQIQRKVHTRPAAGKPRAKTTRRKNKRTEI